MNFPCISCWCPFPVAHNQITITLLYHYMKTRHTFLPPKYSFTVFTPNFRIHPLPLPVPQLTPQRRPLGHFPASHPPAMPRLAEILYFYFQTVFRGVVKADGDVINSGKEQAFTEWRVQQHSSERWASPGVGSVQVLVIHPDLGYDHFYHSRILRSPGPFSFLWRLWLRVYLVTK